MKITTVDEVLSILFNEMGTVTLAILVLLFGSYVKKRVNFLRKYCVPTPVIGGIIFALLNLLLYKTEIVSVNLTNTYQNDFQFMFFTIVGYGASITLLKKGGSKLIKYFILTGILILSQGILGVIAADIAGVHRIYGIISGPAPLAGGHGSVAAYGQMAEDLRHNGAMVIGMASATFGLIAGSLLGGPLCDRLIRKNNLKNTESFVYKNYSLNNNIGEEERDYIKEEDVLKTTNDITVQSVFKHIAIIGVFMTTGNYLGNIITELFKVSLPGFVGPMIVAFVVRNFNEKFNWFNVNQTLLDSMSDISLGIFLSMAMISLKLWELFELAIPLLIILSVLLAFTLIFVYFVVFTILGKDFDSAVMCAGLIGHGLGATPNAIANMESVSEKYGVSRVAFLIVPIVGGFLQDLFLVPVNVFLINLFG